MSERHVRALKAAAILAAGSLAACSQSGSNTGSATPSSRESRTASPARPMKPLPPFTADWIGYPGDDSDKVPEPAPQFRTDFDIDRVHGKIVHATLFITGLGGYDCRINGRPVSDQVLGPGWTDYHKTVLYNQFDVTPLLTPGANAIGVTLGNGPYNVLKIKKRYTKFTGSFGLPKLRAELVIDLSDGTRQILKTDPSWRTLRGPVLFNHQYGGEDYDARMATGGWTEPSYTDFAWPRPVTVSPPGEPGHPAKLMLAPQPPDKICHVYRAQKLTQPKPGVFVYDLGQNMSGWPEIAVSGPAGAAVKMIPGELLDHDGLVSQKGSGGPMWYTYTLDGDGVEHWHPQFSYYGFRYVEITGADAALPVGIATRAPYDLHKVTIHRVAGDFVHADLASAGSFATSSDTLNRIHTLINMAILSNAQSVLTDCPHREKLGWLEQSHLMAHAIMMNWNVCGLYTKIENDIADAQHPDGLIPDIAPEYTHFKGGFLDSPEWGSAGIIAPWYTYVFYGDKQPLADHYDTMKRYAAYLGSRAQDNILDFGLGDWYDIGPKAPGVAQLTSKALTATATYYQDLTILHNAAELLGKPDDAKEFAARAAAVKETFNRKFFHPDTNEYENGSQTANAMPLALGLVPENARAAVLYNLVTAIRANHNEVTAGDVGFSYVVRALTDAGEGDLLYDMATQSNGPGYVMQLRKGATTLTEAWDASGHSQNHLMLGHIETWFYEGLGGIQPDPAAPGFAHFFLRPEFPRDLTSVNVTHETPHGQIASSWQSRRGRIVYRFTVPPGTSATLVLPHAQLETLGPGEYERTVSRD